MSSNSIPLIENIIQSSVYSRVYKHSMDVMDQFILNEKDLQCAKDFEKCRHDDLSKAGIMRFNIDLSYHDLRTLRKETWLNDEIVNFYMALLSERDDCDNFAGRDLQSLFFSSFFMFKLRNNNGYRDSCPINYSLVERWAATYNIFDYNRIFIPINITNTHWVLAVVFLQDKKIMLFDSLKTKNMVFLKQILEYLKLEWARNYGDRINEWQSSDWDLIDTIECLSPQTNNTDCGVFMLLYANLLAQNEDVNLLQQKKTLEYRKKILSSIFNRSLLPAGPNSTFDGSFKGRSYGDAIDLNQTTDVVEKGVESKDQALDDGVVEMEVDKAVVGGVVEMEVGLNDILVHVEADNEVV